MPARSDDNVDDLIETIDARGLACPEPVMRLRARLRAGDAPPRVRLLADDPLAPVDVEAWCARTRHRLVATTRDGAVFTFTVERGDGARSGSERGATDVSA